MKKQPEELFDRLACTATDPLEPPVQSLRSKCVRGPGIITSSLEKTLNHTNEEEELPDGLDIAKDDVEAVIHKEKPRTSLYTITFRDPQFDVPSKFRKSKLLRNDRLLKPTKNLPQSFPKTPLSTKKRKHIEPSTRTFQKKRKKTKPRISSIRDLTLDTGIKTKQKKSMDRRRRRKRYNTDIYEEHVLFQPSVVEQVTSGISYTFRAIMNWFLPTQRKNKRNLRREYLRRIKMRKKHAERERRKAQEDRKQRRLEHKNDDETDDQLEFYSPLSSHQRSRDPITISPRSCHPSQFRKNNNATFVELSHDQNLSSTPISSESRQTKGYQTPNALNKASNPTRAPPSQLPHDKNDTRGRPGSIRYNGAPNTSLSSSSSPFIHQNQRNQMFPPTPDPGVYGASNPGRGFVSNANASSFINASHQYQNQNQYNYPQPRPTAIPTSPMPTYNRNVDASNTWRQPKQISNLGSPTYFPSSTTQSPGRGLNGLSNSDIDQDFDSFSFSKYF